MINQVKRNISQKFTHAWVLKVSRPERQTLPNFLYVDVCLFVQIFPSRSTSINFSRKALSVYEDYIQWRQTWIDDELPFYSNLNAEISIIAYNNYMNATIAFDFITVGIIFQIYEKSFVFLSFLLFFFLLTAIFNRFTWMRVCNRH